MCSTCDKKLSKKKIPCQSVYNKLQIYELPSEISEIRLLERVLVSKRIIFKKVTIMPKGQFPKVKGALCNVPIDNIDVASILPRKSDSNGIVLVKLKRKLQYKGHVYFEGVRPDFILQVLQYLKLNNNLYADIEINTDNIPRELININNDVDFEINSSKFCQYLLKDINAPISISLQTEAGYNHENSLDNDDELETMEDPLDVFRFSANETVLMSCMPVPEDIDNEILTVVPGEGIKPISILNDKYCKELAHPHLFPTGQFGYKIER